MNNQELTDYIEKNINEINITTLNVLVQLLPTADKEKIKKTIEKIWPDKFNSQYVEYDYTTFQFSKDNIPKNESIRTLLSMFNNSKSGKIIHARRELKKRFPYQDYPVQRKILDAIVKKGTKLDITWASPYLSNDNYWKAEYLDTVIKIWENDTTKWRLTKVVSERASSDYIRDYLEKHHSNTKSNATVYNLFATRIAEEDPSFVIDKKQLFPMQYVFCCAKTNRKISHDDAIAGFYNCIADSFNRLYFDFDDFDDCIRYRKKIRFFFYCLRDLGMVQEIVECNEWITKVSRAIKQSMIDKFGKLVATSEREKRYKTFLHKSIIPQNFPSEYVSFIYNFYIETNTQYIEPDKPDESQSQLFDENGVYIDDYPSTSSNIEPLITRGDESFILKSDFQDPPF